MTKSKSRIRAFKSVQEEAEFWDSHNFTDFLDELKPVKVRVSQNLSHITHMRFDEQTFADVETEANKKKISARNLIRMWVMERLSESGNTGTTKAA
jgi:hypothetical protein